MREVPPATMRQAGRSGERHAGASAALGMERGRVERHLRGGSTAALDPAPRAFDSGRDAGGAAAFDRSVVAEEFSVADEAARAGGSEFDGATCRRAFQFDFGTSGGRDAFEGPRHRFDGDVRGAVGLDRGVGACRLSFQFDHGTSGGRDAFEGARHRLDGDVCRAAGLDRGVIGLQRVFGRDFGGSAGF